MDKEPEKKKLKPILIKWLKTLFVFIVLFLIISLIGFLPGIGFLRYYIDGHTINRNAFSARLGQILWEKPTMMKGDFNKASNNLDFAISPDGSYMIFTHKFSPDNQELYISYFRDGSWTTPALIEEVNTGNNERNPDISYDGKLLFFSSDRRGGKGGFDIWCSMLHDKTWSRPFHLGGKINSKQDDLFPELSPDGKALYFSSDRPVIRIKKGQDPSAPQTKTIETTDFNLYRAERIQDEALVTSKGPPAFHAVSYINALNSPYNEGKLTVTGRGDIVYYSSDRPEGIGGYDLYRSHFLGGNFTEPENFGLPVNSSYDEISPTLSMEGFKIFFSSNRYNRSRSDFRFYQCMSRQIVSKFDYGILLAVLLMLASVLLIYIVLKVMVSNVDMQMVTKCLLASVLLHLLLLLLSSGWFIGGKIKETLLEGPEEMTININNLARENIAISIREGIASLPKVSSTLPAVNPQKMPAPTQRQPVAKPSDPVARQPAKSPASVTPEAVAEVTDNTSSPEPFSSNDTPAVMPALLGSSTIRMETPGGKGKEASGSSKGKGHDLPKPQAPRPTPKQKPYQVVKVTPAMTLQSDATVNDTTDVPAAVLKSGLTQPVSNAVPDSDSYDKALLETLPGINELVKEAGGNRKTVSSSGMFLLSSRLKMEEGVKGNGDSEGPTLGLLKRDNNLLKILDFDYLKKNKSFFYSRLIREMLITDNVLNFKQFAPMQIIFSKETELRPVGNLLYQGSPTLELPADSELEVPENYQP